MVLQRGPNIPFSYGERSGATDGGVTREVVQEATDIVSGLTQKQREENFSEMAWIKEGLVSIEADRVVIGNIKVLNIDYNNHYNFDRALQAGAVRRNDFNLLRRTVGGSNEEFGDFCERVLDIRKGQVYRCSSTGTRAIPDIVRYTEEYGFLAGADNSHSTEEQLPAIFIEK